MCNVLYAQRLSDAAKDAVWTLFSENMGAQYRDANCWDESAKKGELFHTDSRYLLVWGKGSEVQNTQSATGNALRGYVMWRFDTDPSDDGDAHGLVPVAYWCAYADSYELQVAHAYQRSGLGAALMHALECVGTAGGMHKVVLTVFVNNRGARRFYRRQGYATDETSPEEEESIVGASPGRYPPNAYMILSKALRERAEHPGKQ